MTSTLADTARSTCCHGQYGGAPLDSAAGPHATGTPRAAANLVSSSAMRVLPIPGSPRHSTTRGCAARADSKVLHERGQLPIATNQFGAHQRPSLLGNVAGVEPLEQDGNHLEL